MASRGHRNSVGSLRFESLESRRLLDGAGLAGNDNPPNLDLSAIPDQVVTIGETLTLDILAVGGTLTDLDSSGQPTGDVLRMVLDPDTADVPLGVSIQSGVLSWTPTADQIGAQRIVVIGIDRGSPPLADAEVLTVTVNLLANQPPVVDLNGDGEGVDTSASFTEDGGPIAVLDAVFAITDADDTTMNSASVSISNLIDGTAESLSVDTGSTSILQAYNSETGVLSLNGVDSIAAYEQVFRSLTYNNTSQNPDPTDRVLAFTVNDGSAISAVAEALVSIQPRNDPPDLAPIANETALTDQQVEFTVTATDPDGDDLTFQIDDDPNTPAGATIEQTSNTTAVVRWTPTEADGLGDFDFRILVTDQGTPPLSDSEAMTVTVAISVEVASPSAVVVHGDALPMPPVTGLDSGIGLDAPEFSTLTNTGELAEVTYDGTVSTLIGVVSHQCSHCRAEIPRIVDWLDANDLPANVRLILISSLVDATGENFPPSKWLAEENWPLDVLVDSQNSVLASALGAPGFPYWISIDSAGKVITRYVGEVTTEMFTYLVNTTAGSVLP